METTLLEELDVKAPPGSYSTFDSETLLPYVQKLAPGDVYLEIGVDKGKSLWMARQIAKKGVEVYGMDIREDPKIEGTTFIQGDAHKSLKNWKKKINVLFIDGDHTYEGCKANIDDYYPFMVEGGIMLFHDCDEGGPGVVRAVAEFVDTHVVSKWTLHKSSGKNTSMCSVRL